MEEKSTKLTAAILYAIVLYALWTVLELLVVPAIQTQLSETAFDLIKEVVLKTLIWAVPSVYFIRKYDKALYIGKDEICSVGRSTLWVLPGLLLITVYFLAFAWQQYGKITVNPAFQGFRATGVLVVLFVGIGEELVFRGWLLNAMLQEKRQWLPVLLNAVLFVLIHFPVWFREGMLGLYLTSGAFLQIMVLAVVLSWSFIKSRSIVVSVILHVYWNLMCEVF